MPDLLERLQDVRLRVARAAERAHRLPSQVQVVAVSKTVGAEMVMEAYRLGQTHFGENRTQELRDKTRVLANMGPMPDACWHLVGHLQSNKVKPAVELSDIIESVDSVRLAELVDLRAGELGRKLPVLLQVDFTAEPQRSGFVPEELLSAAEGLASLGNLAIQGLMTIAPLGLDEDELRRVFRSLVGLRDLLAGRCPRVDWRHLSMGMTDDFEIAIEEGSTIVRIGRAIFGERPYP